MAMTLDKCPGWCGEAAARRGDDEFGNRSCPGQDCGPLGSTPEQDLGWSALCTSYDPGHSEFFSPESDAHSVGHFIDRCFLYPAVSPHHRPNSMHGRLPIARCPGFDPGNMHLGVVRLSPDRAHLHAALSVLYVSTYKELPAVSCQK